jgi:hypothetical protein
VGRPPRPGQALVHGRRKETWLNLQARPYLRARFQLGDALRLDMRPSEAAAHFEALLELNPEDQQRARDPLLGCYLMEQDLDKARGPLERFPDDRQIVS